MQGFVHAYFGDGAGKTTRSIGMCVRALGAGRKVFFIQFMKDGTSSEVELIRTLPNLEYRCTGTLGFIFDRTPTEEEKELARKGLEACKEALRGGYDVVVADEILNAVGKGLIGEKDLIALIDARPGNVELVLTGRPCPDSILERCDYATELKNVKHPHERGVEGRKGIDY
ncbi:MAG: cob(I)yrinic acid a,c-diamide adenosyltransferase [Candidatus Methanofastidiosa archaeon]|nr:cob(I)yrinic acid a,c-diamide adenosyltransferase [Candidatus Methanofastidiosa archaeon]